MTRRSRTFLVGVAVGAALLASAPAVAQPGDAAAKLQKALADSRAALNAYLAAVDRAEYDLKAAAAALGNDPAQIFAFVRDYIGYEEYEGALRGAAGCLRAQARAEWACLSEPQPEHASSD